MEPLSLKYALTGITTERFGALHEPKTRDVLLNVSVGIKTSYNDRRLGLALLVKFEEKRTVFMEIETTCHFQIEDHDWNELSNGMQRNVELPKEFVQHLLSICVGVTRGVLHSKTENTPYNKYFLPLIDISQIGVKSVVIER